MKYLIKFKIFESLEERTSKSFKEWYKKVQPTHIDDEDDLLIYNYQLESALRGWLTYKPYFEDKNIFSYNTYEDYEIAFIKAKTKYAGKLKNVQEDIDYSIIYEDDKVKVIKPLTLNGSCKYGFNTKWCTAMLERPEHFDSYKRDGELYRFIFNDDKKYSLHWANNGKKNWRNQLDDVLHVDRELSGFVLYETPFKLNYDAKFKISVDFVTEKWNGHFCKEFRKKNNIKTIEEYINYYKFWIE